MADILNQSRNLRRTVSAEYVEDTYSNIESAMWNMM